MWLSIGAQWHHMPYLDSSLTYKRLIFGWTWIVTFQGESRSNLMVQLHSIYSTCYKWSSNHTPILYCLAVVVNIYSSQNFWAPPHPYLRKFFVKIKSVYGSSCTPDCHKYLSSFSTKETRVRFEPRLFYLRKHLNTIWYTCQHLNAALISTQTPLARSVVVFAFQLCVIDTSPQ